jgi:HEPN domain-containing protein
MNYEKDFNELFEETGLLNRYITEGRYPGDLPYEAIGKTDAEEAIAAAEKIESFVLGKIKNASRR